VLNLHRGAELAVDFGQPLDGERVAQFASATTDRIAGAVSYTLTSAGPRHTLYDMQPGASYGVAATMSGSDVRIAVTPGGSDVSADDPGVLGFDVAETTSRFSRTQGHRRASI
jgi:hypothetical protein